MTKNLIVIVGPTGVGKTATAVHIAQKFNTQVISADSRQFFIEMQTGTARPTEEELQGIPHHLLGHLSIHQPYDAAQFEKDALEILDIIFKTNDYAIVVGGSGLYISALCQGFDAMPHIPPTIRDTINQAHLERGLIWLQQQVQKHDPAYYAQVDTKNPQRLIRALEVCLGTGQPYSSFRAAQKKPRPFNIIKIGLELPRAQLYSRLDQRMLQMLDNGLEQEAAALYPHKHINALQTLGYKEVFDHMDGLYDRQEMIRLLQQNNRRYAKRQLTWFKRDDSITWFAPTQLSEMLVHIQNHTAITTN